MPLGLGIRRRKHDGYTVILSKVQKTLIGQLTFQIMHVFCICACALFGIFSLVGK